MSRLSSSRQQDRRVWPEPYCHALTPTIDTSFYSAAVWYNSILGYLLKFFIRHEDRVNFIFTFLVINQFVIAKKSKKGSSFLHKLFNLYFWLVHQRCNKTELNLLHTILIFIFDHFSPPEMILVSWRYGTRAGSQKMLQFVLKILSYTARTMSAQTPRSALELQTNHRWRFHNQRNHG